MSELFENSKEFMVTLDERNQEIPEPEGVKFFCRITNLRGITEIKHQSKIKKITKKTRLYPGNLTTRSRSRSIRSRSPLSGRGGSPFKESEMHATIFTTRNKSKYVLGSKIPIPHSVIRTQLKNKAAIKPFV